MPNEDSYALGAGEQGPFHADVEEIRAAAEALGALVSQKAGTDSLKASKQRLAALVGSFLKKHDRTAMELGVALETTDQTVYRWMKSTGPYQKSRPSSEMLDRWAELKEIRKVRGSPRLPIEMGLWSWQDLQVYDDHEQLARLWVVSSTQFGEGAISGAVSELIQRLEDKAFMCIYVFPSGSQGVLSDAANSFRILCADVREYGQKRRFRGHLIGIELEMSERAGFAILYHDTQIVLYEMTPQGGKPSAYEGFLALPYDDVPGNLGEGLGMLWKKMPDNVVSVWRGAFFLKLREKIDGVLNDPDKLTEAKSSNGAELTDASDGERKRIYVVVHPDSE